MALSKSTPLEIIPGLILDGQLSTGQDVIVSGSYSGDLITGGELVILGTGKISGKLKVQALTIDIGGEMDAEITVGQKSVEKITKAAGPESKP